MSGIVCQIPKTSEPFRTHLDAFQRIRVGPYGSEWIQAHSETKKNQNNMRKLNGVFQYISTNSARAVRVRPGPYAYGLGRTRAPRGVRVRPGPYAYAPGRSRIREAAFQGFRGGREATPVRPLKKRVTINRELL